MISNHRQITRVVRERERETEKERKKREGKRNRERETEKRERQTEKERGEIVIALICQTNCHTVHEGKPDETSKF